jgi:hypothetical protein
MSLFKVTIYYKSNKNQKESVNMRHPACWSLFVDEDLELQLGTAPVSSLGVIADLVAGLHTKPLRKWTILLGGFCELALYDERLVSGHRLPENSSNSKFFLVTQ